MNTLDLLLSSACTVSHVTRVRDYDPLARRSYGWYVVNFEMTAIDQTLGIQVLELTISDEVYARYRGQLGPVTYHKKNEG